MIKFSIILMMLLNFNIYAQSNMQINTAKMELDLKILELQAKIKMINMMHSLRSQIPYLLKRVGGEILFLVKSQIPYKYYREYKDFLDKYNRLHDSYISGDQKLFEKSRKDLKNFTKSIKNIKFKNMILPYINKIKWTGKYVSGDIEESNPIDDLSFIFLKMIEEPLEKTIDEKKSKETLKEN